MKTSVASLFGAAGVVACASCASAFVVPTAVAVRASPAASRQVRAAAPNSSRRTMRLSAEKKEDEEDQEPMDLDLEQMFEVRPVFLCEPCPAKDCTAVDNTQLAVESRLHQSTSLYCSCIGRVSNRFLAELSSVHQNIRCVCVCVCVGSLTLSSSVVGRTCVNSPYTHPRRCLSQHPSTDETCARGAQTTSEHHEKMQFKLSAAAAAVHVPHHEGEPPSQGPLLSYCTHLGES